MCNALKNELELGTGISIFDHAAPPIRCRRAHLELS